MPYARNIKCSVDWIHSVLDHWVVLDFHWRWLEFSSLYIMAQRSAAHISSHVPRPPYTGLIFSQDSLGTKLYILTCRAAIETV